MIQSTNISAVRLMFHITFHRSFHNRFVYVQYCTDAADVITHAHLYSCTVDSQGRQRYTRTVTCMIHWQPGLHTHSLTLTSTQTLNSPLWFALVSSPQPLRFTSFDTSRGYLHHEEVSIFTYSISVQASVHAHACPNTHGVLALCETGHLCRVIEIQSM